MMLETLCNIPAKPQNCVSAFSTTNDDLEIRSLETHLTGLRDPGNPYRLVVFDPATSNELKAVAGGSLRVQSLDQAPNEIHQANVRKVGQVGQLRLHKNSMKKGTWPMIAKLANFSVNPMIEAGTPVAPAGNLRFEYLRFETNTAM